MSDWVSGVDGCPAGWFRSSMNLQSRELRFDIIMTASGLLSTEPCPSVLAIDIPIGLPDAGPRECDVLARKLLGRPRASSVFPAPVRAALEAKDREQAATITQSCDGRRVGAQAWGIYPKVREIDELLQSSPKGREIVFEVHPEVSFWAWSGGEAIVESKKTKDGQTKRLRLAENWLGAGIKDEIRKALPVSKRILATDDILDSLAALWTACRISRGEAGSIPADPPLDSTGLPMRMVY